MTARARGFATAIALGLCVASPLAGAAEAFAHGLLFRVDRAGAQTSWVFGTIHSADPRALALPPAVARAFARARTFAAEILLTDVDADDFSSMAELDQGRSLRDLFDGETLEALRRALAPSALPDATLMRMKPWALMLRLAQDPATAGATLDAALLAAARARPMAVVGLELPAEQASAFDAVPLDAQIAIVGYLLRERAALVQHHAASVDAWLARDLARLAALASAPPHADAATVRHFAALARELVDNRSVLMAHRLFLPLRHGGVFVAVGALHLYGERGLLALLRDQGYRVRRVY